MGLGFGAVLKGIFGGECSNNKSSDAVLELFSLSDRVKCVKHNDHKMVDANGVVIREGDVVLDVFQRYEGPLVVAQISSADLLTLRSEDGEEIVGFAPEELAYVQPAAEADGTASITDGTCPNEDRAPSIDSWEQLEKDLWLTLSGYCEKAGLGSDGDWEDLKERRNSDVVRRAKALAGSEVDRPGEVE